MTKKKLRGKKKLMYEMLLSQLGNVTASSKQVGIERTTHYLWLRTDENYKAWIEEMPEYRKDFVEHQLLTAIKNGNMTGIIFYLKTQAKDRGYIEKTEQSIEHKGSGFKFIMEAPDGASDKVEAEPKTE